MAIRIYLILFVVIPVCVFGQGTEVQRKYTVEQPLNFQYFIKNSDQIGKVKMNYHSSVVYYDLYFDTPNHDLFKNKLSLRLRKRVGPGNNMTYGFQLKSEMKAIGGERLEVEETELDFYLIKVGKEWVGLSSVLDQIFSENVGKNNDDIKILLKAIKDWMAFKSGAPISPFQKLKYLYPDVFTDTKIGTLEPVVIGISDRLRSHLYLDRSVEKDSIVSYSGKRVAISELPIFFRENPFYLWLYETSFDISTFYPLLESEHNSFEITEFEVENKLIGTNNKFIGSIETELKTKYKLKHNLDSKYRQSVQYFYH